MVQEPSGLIDAVVLADGVNTIPLFEGCKPGYKALLPIGGRPSILYTLDALLGVDRVGHICIVGPGEELQSIVGSDTALNGRCEIVEGGDTLLASIRAGLARYPGASRVLVATADMPLISAEAIADFLEGCEREPIEDDHVLYLSAVPESAFSGSYQAADKMFSRYRDASICQGNLGLVDPWILHDPETAARVDLAYAGRKGRLSSALAFGWAVGLSYIFGVALFPLLSLHRFARIVSHRFGFGVVPVLCPHPEIAVDMDEPADYAFVLDRLGLHTTPPAPPPAQTGRPATLSR